jgi:rubredoxin
MAQHRLLELTETVECPECNTLSATADFTQAISDEDDFECSSCGWMIHRRTPTVVLFKMSDKALAGARPVIPNASLDASPIVAEEPLSERSQYVLIAMLDLGAVDSDGRRPTAVIAIKALGKQADANSLKTVMADLSTRNLIRTRTGPGGGCWLTERGIARANKLRRARS